LHIPKAETRIVLENIKRVLAPSGLFYLGIYGSEEESEGIWEQDTYSPKRFFSFYNDANIQNITAKLFTPLYFKRIPVSAGHPHFQSLILEKPNQ